MLDASEYKASLGYGNAFEKGRSRIFLRNASGTTVFSAGMNSRQSAFLTNINHVNNEIEAFDWQHCLEDSKLNLKYSNLYVDDVVPG